MLFSFLCFTFNHVIDWISLIIQASWMDGLYVANALKPLNGMLTIPLASGAKFNLHLSKVLVKRLIFNLKLFF